MAGLSPGPLFCFSRPAPPLPVDPGYKEDFFVIAIQFGLPILLMLALLFSVISIARAVAYEKEKGLKIALQMMGMPNWMHWAGWFLIQFAGLFLALVPVTIELADGEVYSCLRL